MICQETARALDVAAATVMLYDGGQDALCLAADFGLPPEYRERYIPIPRAIYDEYAPHTGPIIVAPDVQTLPGLPNGELYAALNIRTIVGASVLRGGELVGGLGAMTFGEVRDFNADDLTLLQGLADQAVQAITNARLFEEIERRLSQLHALRTVDAAIGGSLDLRLTLKIIVEQVATQLGVDAADVLLLNPHSQMLEYAAGRGFHTVALQHTRLRLSEGHAGRAALERRTISIPNLAGVPDGLSLTPLLRDEGFVAYYAVPLVAKGQVKGVLELFHRALLEPDSEWLEFLDTLAGQVAIAIDNAALFDELQRSNLELALSYDATLEGWTRALDLRDKETEGHSERVTEMTVGIGRVMGISEAELAHVRRGALLHDIGKMAIPDAILLKPGPLTQEEKGLMRKHPIYAYELLLPIVHLRPALDIPYCHHERWDGTGYPRGLKGEGIPLAARVFAVVDVWDALRSDRPYRPAWPEDKAREYLRSQAGGHFDPRVVEVFPELKL